MCPERRSLAGSFRTDGSETLKYIRVNVRPDPDVLLILLSYLMLICFIYPSKRKLIPDWLMKDLFGVFDRELESPPIIEKLCRGTLLSTSEYLIDVESRGYEDAREQLLSLAAKKIARIRILLGNFKNVNTGNLEDVTNYFS